MAIEVNSAAMSGEMVLLLETVLASYTCEIAARLLQDRARVLPERRGGIRVAIGHARIVECIQEHVDQRVR